MNQFEKREIILKTPPAQKVIKHFNHVASVLMQFELLYFEGWKQQVDGLKTGECLF